MPNTESGKIRNVAVIGHRGTGKTSLVEALLYESGTTNRLGAVAERSTVSDYDDEERRRGMSISATVTHLEWQGRNINLIDTPGEPSFQADVLSTLRVVEGAIVTVFGRAGGRGWHRAPVEALRRARPVPPAAREPARSRAGRLLRDPRGAADPALAAMRGGRDPDRAGARVPGVVDLVHMVAYLHDGDGAHDEPADIPDEMREVADEYHDKLMDIVAETSDELMERYLEGVEISREEMAQALKNLVTEGELFPVGCGAATRNIGSRGPARPDRRGPAVAGRARNVPEVGGASTLAYVFKTIADPYSGKINLLRVFAGTLTSDSTLVNNHTHAKERIGQLLVLQGKEHTPTDALGSGSIGAVAKLKETGTGDVLSDADSPAQIEPLAFPSPVVSFAIEPKHKGEEEKVHTSLRRLQEEDPSLDIHRDPQTGETIVAGLSQMHVEVTLERMHRRFGVEVTLHPPRVPYMETIRRPARAQGRYKKQTGGRGQFGDCHITIEPLSNHEGYEFVDKIVGGVIPQGFRPAVDKGIQEAMQQGELAGCPIVGVKVQLVDGSYHTVDSSEMAFKIAGSMAFKKAFAEADPVLLEPIMRVEVTVPDESLGDVIGDMTSRRGRVGGMDPASGSTTIHVEVPLAEVLTYAPDLNSMTGGRGDYQMSLLRYDEVPAHVAQQIISKNNEKELAKA